MTSLKRLYISFFAILSLVVFAAQYTSAQLRLPRPSQSASVMQTIGVTDVTITYSRPGVKGRKIWGDAPKDSYAKGESTLDNQNLRPVGMPIVPYGHVWRTGANEATQFVITSDVMINGQKLAAGSYSLHTIPGKTEWTIVFNGTANQWGSFSYDPAKDTLRVKAKPLKAKGKQEWLMFSIDPMTDTSATVNICWEKVRVPFTVDVDVPAVTLEKARVVISVAKADDWRIRYNAGNYAMQNKYTADGTQWLEQALKILDTLIAAKETFQNLSGKANVLLAAGRKDEALAVADKAITRGKADKADTTVFEKRIADIKAGKQ